MMIPKKKKFGKIDKSDLTHPVEQRIEDRKYLDWLRELPCFFTGRISEARDPMHIGKLGKAIKEHDCHVVPGLHSIHNESEANARMGEKKIWKKYLSPLAVKECLQAVGCFYYLRYKTGCTSNIQVVKLLLKLLEERK